MSSSSLTHDARRAIGTSTEATWNLGFALAGRLWHRPLGYWTSPGRQRILVIAPHPDDEVAGCAGTIIRHHKSGDEICVAYITDGRMSRALGMNAEEMAHRRKREAQAAADTLGVDRLEWIGLPEGGWTAAQLQPRLQALIAELSPHLIYAPSRIDFHPEHDRVAHVFAALLSDQEKQVRVPWIRIYQVQVPLTPSLTNLLVETLDVSAESLAAFAAYITQSGSITQTLRLRHYAARLYGVRGQAEEFWQVTPAGYRRLHQGSGRLSTHFRGIRPNAMTDPLAYLYGIFERRRLVRFVEGNS